MLNEFTQLPLLAPEKRCPRCLRVLPVSAFGRHKGRLYDASTYCRQCRMEYEHDWRQDNPEQAKERAAQKSRKAIEWHRHNPEQTLAIRARYRQRRRAEIRMSDQARRSGGSNALTVAQWDEIVAFYGNRCLACGAIEKITMDHIVPVSLGGKTEAANVQPLCRHCNSKKSTKIIDYPPKD